MIWNLETKRLVTRRFILLNRVHKLNIIRNDILNNFLKKISFSNKEKEVLLVKKTAEKTFFDLLKRILLLSDNVKLISDNRQ